MCGLAVRKVKASCRFVTASESDNVNNVVMLYTTNPENDIA